MDGTCTNDISVDYVTGVLRTGAGFVVTAVAGADTKITSDIWRCVTFTALSKRANDVTLPDNA